MLRDNPDERQRIFADPHFRADVLAGLVRRPRAIPARWFYDQRGSELFEAITKLPEYYPTRIETNLLEEACPAVAGLAGKGRAVVEFGSGSSIKTPILLRAVAPSCYVPIDISGDFLRSSAAVLSKAFPDLPVLPLEVNFMGPLDLPAQAVGSARLGFFPGSTIGNLSPRAATDLLRAIRATLGEGAMLLIGMDRLKDRQRLIAAYDDEAGVTAAFNLNLLERINRELSGDIPVEAFCHRAIWNDDLARIEMHLEAMRDVTFTIEGHDFKLAAGETIHTENSHKYAPRAARLLLAAGGWTPVDEWVDSLDSFALYLAEAQPIPPAP